MQLDPPEPGPHRPVESSPPLRPGSARRTATTTMTRPDGLHGPVVLDGLARDVRVDPDGTVRERATGSMRAEIDFSGDRKVTALITDPPNLNVARLLGLRAGSGFRTVLETDLALERLAATPTYLLLDDIPVTTLISGYALGRSGHRPLRTGAHPPTPNLCAGWQEGGTMMVSVLLTGRTPLPMGPPAPDDTDAGPGWHETPSVPPRGMRRARRIDVTQEGGDFVIDAMFRDAYADDFGVRSVVHEYVVSATVDSDLVLTAIVAEPRVLPWPECPSAAASAGRLVGAHIGDLRSVVRQDFSGESTCTHLNDLLRSLDDVAALIPLLPRVPMSAEPG